MEPEKLAPDVTDAEVDVISAPLIINWRAVFWHIFYAGSWAMAAYQSAAALQPDLAVAAVVLASLTPYIGKFLHILSVPGPPPELDPPRVQRVLERKIRRRR